MAISMRLLPAVLLILAGAAKSENIGNPEPIQAVAIPEPLQKRSLTFQKLRREYLLAQFRRILPAEDTPRGIVITLPESMLSPGDSLPESTSERLARLAELIPPDVTVRVLGYTGDLGNSGANARASVGRAQAVSDLLSSNNDAPLSIQVAGFVSGLTKSRVEILISGEGIGGTTLRTAAAPRRNLSTRYLLP